MMTSFCNTKVHPFLSLPNSKHHATVLDFSIPRQNIIGGDNSSIDTNYLEFTPMTPPAAGEKKDPGGIGFLDEVGGSVDGLMSCTESLGFESSDERTVDDQIEDLDHHNHRDEDLLSTKSKFTNNLVSTNSRCWLQGSNLERKEKKKFPPPLSSLSQDGKPNFFLRAVRKDGRLEMTEVKISRPQTLLASRQDGRLRLHLVCDLENEEEEEENEDSPVETEEHLDDEQVIEENDDEEEVVEWKFPVKRSGSGDVHRRCYGGNHGQGRNNHHHDLHVWRQRCVITR